MRAWPVRSACGSVRSIDVVGCTFETCPVFQLEEATHMMRFDGSVCFARVTARQLRN
jgi:hypothetical protein